MLSAVILTIFVTVILLFGMLGTFFMVFGEPDIIDKQYCNIISALNNSFYICNHHAIAWL